ncbi:NAD(P)/FAD-dependent oxidoreductase [Mucilaginibacter lappiensis]|uniref:FADH2 O2-dependent halogenase n=1 Tax=Mucilaginibacter lappiensis TaxID=354630 RepID=A0A841JD10_9SPHI|nr:tryptophan 7-halogenase [Mucilaginibacter lappiensis]MBB6126488.1 FADH2 O2-dependent halogenase [Mucilaginibacter lappiensis]
MTERNIHDCDILVAGAGFGGSLMALVLNSQGFRVCLVEKGQHPRFAIGESSTPIADMILRQISQQYNLPWLKDFSRYGSWQQSHPEIVCGIKRGFSYFKHYPGKEFTSDINHTNELLVAASTDNMQSDTNWLRADFDAFLVTKVKEAGIVYADLTEIISAERDTRWKFQTNGDKSSDITASFFIDATGSGGLLDRLLGIKSSSNDFLTDSFAVFSHFNNVPRWTDMLQEAGIPISDFPYDPDNSALHQILDEGWLWMLRFNDERTSIGFALNRQKNNFEGVPAKQIWDNLLEKYPTIHNLLNNAPLSSQPGTILKSGRLQRKIERCVGPGWAALPHTAGFVDPLFSSGIAHSLSGIQKVAGVIEQYWGDDDQLHQASAKYQDGVFEELKLIDQLVAGCYQTMDRFGLFNAWSMLYFAATIAYEQRLLKQMQPGYFLGADDLPMREMINLCYQDLTEIIRKQHVTANDISQFTELIRQRIAPVNIAGLLDPALKNMYPHTAVNL